jgi:RIP homotypic interaction motif
MVPPDPVASVSDRRTERMDPITLIVTALAAGTSAGAIEALKDDARDAAKRVYAKLRRLAMKRVAGRPDGELALERYESAPKRWETMLAGELTEAGAASDADLIAAAQALMELVDRDGARSGTYNVTIKDSKGVQVGDGNIQINKF